MSSNKNKSVSSSFPQRVSTAQQTDLTSRPDEYDDDSVYEPHSPSPHDDSLYDDDPYNNEPFRSPEEQQAYDEINYPEEIRERSVNPYRDTLYEIPTETVYVDKGPDQPKTILTGARGPSRLTFRCYVYMLIIAQVGLASLQWMFATYAWKPKLHPIERNMNLLLLFLAWLNLTLGFFGFRRLQFTFPLNWIIFVCIFESLTLAVMCLSASELTLTWPYLVAAIAVLFIYSLLGLWVPRMLTADLWILIFVSITVLIASIITIAAALAMHHYVPLNLCLIIFGPWAMYNSQKVHVKKRSGFTTHQYLDAAAKVYINFAMTVGCIAFMSHMSIYYLDGDECRNKWFCPKRPMMP
ncbi:uncharacterized protein LOC117587734 [Drosophila guanche]|uniref:Uncharacterized protein n=1 Tax=Drosophila guanche TaxID=7266 RepID=A0A3B0JZB1_DROGU|nr:uncharacterized protein LOC117587734 [Drosophila guanche]SPP85762.1 Hypothetical predicted protein [Drosophila guanche]